MSPLVSVIIPTCQCWSLLCDALDRSARLARRLRKRLLAAEAGVARSARAD